MITPAPTYRRVGGFRWQCRRHRNICLESDKCTHVDERLLSFHVVERESGSLRSQLSVENLGAQRQGHSPPSTAKHGGLLRGIISIEHVPTQMRSCRAGRRPAAPESLTLHPINSRLSHVRSRDETSAPDPQSRIVCNASDEGIEDPSAKMTFHYLRWGQQA